MNDDTLLLTLRLLHTAGVGPVRAVNALKLLREQGTPHAKVLAEPGTLHGALKADQVRDFSENAGKVLALVDQLNAIGARGLVLGQDGYPQRLLRTLGDKAPPVLFCLGDPKLLDAPAVGFCGSRKASEKGLGVAADCGEQLARAAVNVVSGYATGVDMATHNAALKHGGTTTFVLAEGVLEFRIKGEIREFWDQERVAVVSEFLPRARWSVGNAMQRNRTISGLSDAMILIEAGATGGSIEAGRICLKLHHPLFAAVYDGMPEWATGNRELLALGACQLLRSRSSGRANMAVVMEVVQRSALRKEAPSSPGPVPLFEPRQQVLADGIAVGRGRGTG